MKILINKNILRALPFCLEFMSYKIYVFLDAINSNLNFSKSKCAVKKMIKALKSIKERYRRHYKRSQNPENNMIENNNMIKATKELVIKKLRNKS